MLLIRSLGGLSVWRDAVPMTGAAAQRKRLAILGLLARAGDRGISREKIIAYLWPDQDPERARPTLNQALYALRRDLGDDDTIIGQHELRLNPNLIDSDCARFEAALSPEPIDLAASLYTGPFLDGFFIDQADEFNRWVDEERSALHHRYTALLERLAMREDSADRYAEAVIWWRRLAAAEPLSARVTIHLMKSLATAGDRQGAARHAQVHAALVEQELGGPPDPTVKKFAEELLQDPGTAARPQLPPHPAVPIVDTDVTPPVTPAVHAGPTNRKHRYQWRNWVIAVGFIAVLGLMATWFQSRSSAGAISAGRTTRLTAEAGLELDPTISPNGEMVAYAAGPAENTRIYVKQATGGRAVELAPDLPGPLRLPTWSPDGQSIAFMGREGIYSVPPLGGAVRALVTIDSTGQIPHSPQHSPDGDSLLYIRSGRVILRSIALGTERLLDSLDDPHSPTFSRDGKFLAVVAGNAGFALGSRSPASLGTDIGNVGPSVIHLISVASSRVPRRGLTDGQQFAASPVWAPDNRHLLYISDRDGSRDLWVTDITAGPKDPAHATRLTTGLGAHGISLSRDGKHLAFSLFRKSNNIWRLSLIEGSIASVRNAAPITTGEQNVEGLDLSPDGTTLAFDSDREGAQDIWTIPIAGGEATRQGGTPWNDFFPSWSPDGAELTFYTIRRGLRHIQTMHLSRDQLLDATKDTTDERSPDWSPTGDRLIYSRMTNGRYEFFTVARDTAVRWGKPQQLASVGGSVGRWSPDGKEIAYVDLDNTFAIYLMRADGSGSRLIVRGTGAVGSPRPARVEWSRDGKTLIYRASDDSGRASFRAVDRNGGRDRLLVRFDDPERRSTRTEFTTDGKQLFFTMGRTESDLWMMELHGKW